MAIATLAVVQTSTFVSGTSVTSKTTGSFSSATTAGNTLIAVISWSGAPSTVTIPAGWANITAVSATGITTQVYAYWNALSVAASNTWSWSWVTANDVGIQMYELSGCVEVSATIRTGSGASGTAPTTAAGTGARSSEGQLGIIAIRQLTTQATLSGVTAAYTQVTDTGWFGASGTTTKMVIHTGSISTRGTSILIAGTLSVSSRWTAIAISFASSVGRAFVLGNEGNQALTPFTGTPTRVTSESTTVHSGSKGYKATGTAQTSTSQLKLIPMTWIVFHCYIRFSTLPSADTNLLGFTTGSTLATTVSRCGIQWVTASSKFQAFISNKAGTVASSSPSAAISTNTWYRLEFRFYITDAGTMTMDWYVDDTAQAQVTQTGAWDVGGAPNLIFGSSVACNHTYFFDDIVVLFDPRYTTWPLGALSVVDVTMAAMGTDVGEANFSTDAGAIDSNSYLKVTDAPTITTTYIQQDTNSETSYIEMTPTAFTSGSGCFTAFGLVESTAPPGDLMSTRAVIGGNEYYLKTENEGALFQVGTVPSATTANEFGSIDPMNKAGTATYTDSQMDAALFRVGYGTVGGATKGKWHSLFIEYATLPAISSGNAHWSWALDSSTGSWGHDI